MFSTKDNDFDEKDERKMLIFTTKMYFLQEKNDFDQYLKKETVEMELF